MTDHKDSVRGELLCTLIIDGEPLPKERPRHTGKRTYTPEKTVAAEARIVEAFDRAYPRWEPTTLDIHFEAIFYRKNNVTADIDNLLKLVQDALNGVAYKDDRQIVDLSGTRSHGHGEKARTEVRIWLAGQS